MTFDYTRETMFHFRYAKEIIHSIALHFFHAYLYVVNPLVILVQKYTEHKTHFKGKDFGDTPLNQLLVGTYDKQVHDQTKRLFC